MSYSNHGRFRQQVRLLRSQFLQEGNLPFSDVLLETMVMAPATSAWLRCSDRESHSSDIQRLRSSPMSHFNHRHYSRSNGFGKVGPGFDNQRQIGLGLPLQNTSGQNSQIDYVVVMSTQSQTNLWQ